MHESPRIRRLRNDLASLERLESESSVFRFRASGKPAQQYVIEFRGKSLARERGKVGIRDRHEVEIKLGASYPRTMPELRWLTPIYHPNISEIGMVCLGGYGTHWVPSLNLDELCGMLWDMARFHNYDIRSPYNREAALWVSNQTSFLFPLDSRPLRDLRAALGRIAPETPERSSRQESAVSPATKGNPSSDGERSRAGRYAEFVRRFAADLKSITPGVDGTIEHLTIPQPPETEGVVILDVEVDLRPRPGPSRSNDGIVFIE